MTYKIRWNNETVDTTTSRTEALYLVREYNLAFNGGVTCPQL